MLALALGLLALATARAQAPLTGEFALWTNASYPAVYPPTTACDDTGVCAAFWTISDDGQVYILGSVVSPSGVTAPALLRRGGFIGAPIAVGMQEGFAVFYDEVLTPSTSATVLQLFAEDLSPARPPILLPPLAGRGATYAGTSSVARTPDGFALLGQSAPRRESGLYVSLAFIDMDGRLLRSPVQLNPPALNIGLGLAVQSEGSLVAVYSSQAPASRSGCSQVFVRSIASSGRLLGLLGPAVAVADPSCFQDFPAVSVAADGTFLVAWASAQANNPAVIVAELFSARARPLGKPFRVSQSVAALLPAVSADPSNHYFVVWEGRDPSGAAHDIKGRWLGTDGTPMTPELTLNEAQDDLDHLDQGAPQVAVAIGGFAVVTWQSSVPSNLNPVASSVARVFATPP